MYAHVQRRHSRLQTVFAAVPEGPGVVAAAPDVIVHCPLDAVDADANLSAKPTDKQRKDKLSALCNTLKKLHASTGIQRKALIKNLERENFTICYNYFSLINWATEIIFIGKVRDSEIETDGKKNLKEFALLLI